jgi:GNAT superfamily N-acetyltransferase
VAVGVAEVALGLVELVVGDGAAADERVALGDGRSGGVACCRPLIRDDEGVSITVRRGKEADAGAAADLWLRARKAAAGAIPPPVHGDEDVRAWFASHVVHETDVWLAEDTVGTLVGLLVVEGSWIQQLYVEPTLTGRGIGGELVRLAKRERPEGLRLWTFLSNAGAQRFYERHGFVATRRTDGDDNEEGAPDVLYVWSGRGIGGRAP